MFFFPLRTWTCAKLVLVSGTLWSWFCYKRAGSLARGQVGSMAPFPSGNNLYELGTHSNFQKTAPFLELSTIWEYGIDYLDWIEYIRPLKKLLWEVHLASKIKL